MRALLLGLLLWSASAWAQPWADDCGLQPPGSVPVVPLEPKAWEPVITADTPALVRADRFTPRIGGVPYYFLWPM